MHLSTLSLLNFKNYQQLDVEFGEGVNCLLGDNGEGKTNILDAIHVLSFCKSYFNPIDSQCVRFEEDFYMISGGFKHDKTTDSISCSVKKGRKKAFKRNKSDYEKLADHIGRYPVVMITPYDANLILGGSDIRRKFVDTVIAQFDKSYLSALIRYNKVLDQRNALLKATPYNKKINLDVLDIYDQQLIQFGTIVNETRAAFVEEDLLERFKKLYLKISEGKETPNLSYASGVSADTFEERLKTSLDKDRMSQYTNVGVHKDDLLFEIEGHPLKKFASQGQQKSYLLALKLAYFQCLKEKIDIHPILLLDDIFDKLDRDRVMALMDLIGENNLGQAFITDTSVERVPEILSDLNINHKVFTVKKGNLHEA